MKSRLFSTAMALAFLSNAAHSGEFSDSLAAAGSILGSSPLKELAARSRVPAAAAPRAVKAWPDAIEQAERATVRVETSGHVGTGFIVRASGLVVTNAHVTADAKIGDDLDILLGKTKLKGKYVATGNEDCRDLAFVQLSGRTDWPTLPLSRVAPKRGLEVVSIGFPGGPEDKSGENPLTVAKGIVSGVDRVYPKSDCLLYVQTDASVNSGNSGGPLLAQDGTVIGVNTWGLTDKQQMNFAIGISDLEKALAQYDRVKHLSEGSLGMMVYADEEKKKLIVTQVLTGRAALAAGVRQGDVLLSYGGKAAGEDSAAAAAFVRWVRELVPGDRTSVTVSRGGAAQTISIVVEKFAPAPVQRLAQYGTPRRG
ncbi:MAG: trypsin-like peptidase domain-containing protein [Elusimicrobia bacterium]|nr:trypsin-like peptidase domain-containing protein [Elusimicrobiota bacterium]